MAEMFPVVSVSCLKREVNMIHRITNTLQLHLLPPCSRRARHAESMTGEEMSDRAVDLSLEATTPTTPMASKRSSGPRTIAGSLAEPGTPSARLVLWRLPTQGGMDRKGVESTRSRALRYKK